jgi:hypothetical protein
MISYFTRVTDTTPVRQISIDDFINSVQYGHWKDVISEVRTGKREKKSLPAVTISGVFAPTRLEKNLIQHSGFICLDFDNDIGKDVLCADPYVYAAFYSASGTGLAALIKIRPDKHKESFRWLADHFFKEHGKVCDPAPSNVASARYVSFDPDIYINPTSKTARFEAKTKVIKPLKTIATGTQLERIAADIYNSGIDFAPDYHTYFTTAAAISSELGESGRDMFHTVCRNSPKYDRKQADIQYNHCLDRRNSGIGIGSFLYLAKRAGFTTSTQQESIAITSAVMAAKSNRDEAAAVRSILSRGIPEELAKEAAARVFQEAEPARIKQDDDDTTAQQIAFIHANTNLWRNTITGRIYDGERELDKFRINSLYIAAKQAIGSGVTKTDIEAIIYSEAITDRNPLREYFETLTASSTRALDDILSTIDGENIHYLRKWFIAVVASAMSGDVVRTMPVLIGPQNCGKTWFIRGLFTDELQPYYSESNLGGADKDVELTMCYKLVNLIDELGGVMSSANSEMRFKELTSKQSFYIRAPYSPDFKDIPRLAVLIGTSNFAGVVNDPTGNTRILPVPFRGYNFHEYNRLTKRDVWAAALYAYRAGETYHLSREEVELLRAETGGYKEACPEEELIDKFFDVGQAFYTATDVKIALETETGLKNLNIRKIGIYLSARFKKKTIQGRNGYYLRIKGSAPEPDVPPF